jgi:predicted O-methyltransferase YrrM
MTIEREAIKAAKLSMNIPGQMHEAELAFLYKLARQKGPLVEIGCLHGRSTAVLMQAAKVFGAKVASIDPFLVTPNTMIPSAGLWRSNLENAGLEIPELFELMSHDAAPIYEDEIGMLFVDGGHSYETVKEDIADWAPKIKGNGIICFHDMFQPSIPGVAKAVTEWWLESKNWHGKVSKWRLVGQVDYLIAFRRYL